MPVPNCPTCGNPHSPDNQCRETCGNPHNSPTCAKPHSLAAQLFRSLHEKDSDCTVGADGCCEYCHVDHSDPCPACGGAGFHRPNCFWMSPILAGMEVAA